MKGETVDAAPSPYECITTLIALVFLLLVSLPSSPSAAATSDTTILSPTTTTLLCTPMPLAVNESGTCIATVTTVGGLSPTGTVTLSGNNGGAPYFRNLDVPNPLCSLAVTKSSFQSCSIAIEAWASGYTYLVATYSGDSTHAGSKGSFAFNVIVSATQTTPTTTSETSAVTTTSSSTSTAAAPSIQTRDLIMVGAVLVILGLSGFVFVTERRGKGSPSKSFPPNELGGALSSGQRRLAAIVYTDMVGYTALTQSNEAQAMQMLDRHNKLLRPFFPRFHGREVKAIGDSFLVEFESALDALKCASEIQSYLHDNNVSSKEEWKVKLRIGIHLGDVIHQGGDVFGDAVNIASRIYPIARPEGICISQQVYDQVQNKFDLPLVSLGEKTLKNVSKPVQVYSVQMPWESMDHIPRLET